MSSLSSSCSTSIFSSSSDCYGFSLSWCYWLPRRMSLFFNLCSCYSCNSFSLCLCLSSGSGDFICFLWPPEGLMPLAFWTRLLWAVEGLPLLTLLVYFKSLVLAPGSAKSPEPPLASNLSNLFGLLIAYLSVYSPPRLELRAVYLTLLGL